MQVYFLIFINSSDRLGMYQMPLVGRYSHSNKGVTSRYNDYDVSNSYTHGGKFDSCAQRESAGTQTL